MRSARDQSGTRPRGVQADGQPQAAGSCVTEPEFGTSSNQLLPGARRITAPVSSTSRIGASRSAFDHVACTIPPPESTQASPPPRSSVFGTPPSLETPTRTTTTLAAESWPPAESRSTAASWKRSHRDDAASQRHDGWAELPNTRSTPATGVPSRAPVDPATSAAYAYCCAGAAMSGCMAISSGALTSTLCGAALVLVRYMTSAVSRCPWIALYTLVDRMSSTKR